MGYFESTVYRPLIGIHYWLQIIPTRKTNQSEAFAQLKYIFHASHLRKDIYPGGVPAQSQRALKLW